MLGEQPARSQLQQSAGRQAERAAGVGRTVEVRQRRGPLPVPLPDGRWQAPPGAWSTPGLHHHRRQGDHAVAAVLPRGEPGLLGLRRDAGNRPVPVRVEQHPARLGRALRLPERTSGVVRRRVGRRRQHGRPPRPRPDPAGRYQASPSSFPTERCWGTAGSRSTRRSARSGPMPSRSTGWSRRRCRPASRSQVRRLRPEEVLVAGQPVELHDGGGDGYAYQGHRHRSAGGPDAAEGFVARGTEVATQRPTEGGGQREPPPGSAPSPPRRVAAPGRRRGRPG